MSNLLPPQPPGDFTQPAPYGQPANYVKPLSNAAALWSLILGIVAFLGIPWVWFIIGWWTLPVAIAGLVLGINGWRLAQTAGGR
jgi:hypothetical protein